MAMGSVMGTTSPSGCRIFSSVPVAVESIVMVSLSVSISNRGSPSLQSPPSFTSQFVRVPSVMRSPCFGIIINEAIIVLLLPYL